MKKAVSAILTLVIIFCAFSLSSCNKKDGVPEGMQLVRGGEDVGYNFYGPEEWVVANLGDISSTYASRIDTSGITFVEAVKPEGSVTEYFAEERTRFPYEITVSVDGESCAFGNATSYATKYVYSYTYKEVSYSCMQIFVENEGRFYIFTYTASNEERFDGKSYYEFYFDKVSEVIEKFEFTSKTETPTATPEYETDTDGYILVSDKTLCGFEMYVPADYRVDFSSAIVSVSTDDGVNVTLSETTYPATSQEEYWNNRKESIEAFADKITVNGEEVSSFRTIEEPKAIDVKGADAAAAYEYSYKLDGVEYRVYQVLMRNGTIGGSVYVFTYTASGRAYEDHLDEMNKILGKIEF